jgi:hypothetical protein
MEGQRRPEFIFEHLALLGSPVISSVLEKKRRKKFNASPETFTYSKKIYIISCLRGVS